MGRKYKRSRVSGLIYPTGIILISALIWGCAARDMFQPAGPSDDQMNIHRLISQYDQQIRKKELQKAAQTSTQAIKLIQKSQAKDQEYQLLLLRTNRPLITQVMADKAKNSALESQAKRMDKQLKKLKSANTTLEVEIKRLNQAVRHLEQEKAGLEKQLEQMKQIDLK